MRGAVEEVNERRAVCFVRCMDGTYTYLRVAREELPRVGDVLSWPGRLAPHGATVINESEGSRILHATSAIARLPRGMAQGLVR